MSCVKRRCWGRTEAYRSTIVYSLLYILSAGHSGSTLLDLLAGTIPGVFSTGEVVHLPWQTHRDGRMCELHQDVCTCGAPFRQCPVWGEVIDRVGERLNLEVRADPMRLKTHVLTTQEYRKAILLPYRLARRFISTGGFWVWTVCCAGPSASAAGIAGPCSMRCMR